MLVYKKYIWTYVKLIKRVAKTYLEPRKIAAMLNKTSFISFKLSNENHDSDKNSRLCLFTDQITNSLIKRLIYMKQIHMHDYFVFESYLV